MTAILSAEECGEALDVSRETLERLETYVALLKKWNPKINLVSQSTLADVWRRHILDSGQLLRYGPAEATWLDLGAGAGLPGLILGILGAGPMHLAESDIRKCVFLREAARLTDTPVTVHNGRIEVIAPELRAVAPALITARAFAPLQRLLDWCAGFVTPETRFLLLKGRDVEVELTEAAKSWTMQVDIHASLSHPDGRVLELQRVHHNGF